MSESAPAQLIQLPGLDVIQGCCLTSSNPCLSWASSCSGQWPQVPGPNQRNHVGFPCYAVWNACPRIPCRGKGTLQGPMLCTCRHTPLQVNPGHVFHAREQGKPMEFLVLHLKMCTLGIPTPRIACPAGAGKHPHPWAAGIVPWPNRPPPQWSGRDINTHCHAHSFWALRSSARTADA